MDESLPPALAQALPKFLPEFTPGHVWLCGAGPGEAGLLTLHALNALRQADVVVHDALVGADILALAAASAELHDVGKRGGGSASQAGISALLVARAGAGKRVLRLKGGDPLMFGRGAEEAEALAALNIPYRIIPGVSAGIGGLAAAGIAVTHREVNQAVVFATGHDSGTDWAAIARAAPVIVIYMGLKRIGAISAALQAAGRRPDEPVAIVSSATLPGQMLLESNLGRVAADLAANPLAPPAIICIGVAKRLEQAAGAGGANG